MTKACSICKKPWESEQYKTCDKCRTYSQEWRKANVERARETKRVYHIAHREEITKRVREWQDANPEKVRENEATRRKRDPDRIKQWCQNNKERHSQNIKKWIDTHPTEVKVIQHRRRARKKGNGGSFTADEINGLFEKQEGFCFYCGELLYASFNRNLHIEHKIPLSRGGTSDISNIVLSCAKCNHSKGTKTDEEFLDTQRA
jgi:5-methylcytosine-specific restriction endonuclease McrA